MFLEAIAINKKQLNEFFASSGIFLGGGSFFCLFYVGFFIVFQPISFQDISEWKYFVEITLAELNCSMHVWEGKEQNRGYTYISVLISLANQGI